MKWIDDYLDNITMYRLTLYVLIAYVAIGGLYSIFGILPFNIFGYLFSLIFIISVSWVANTVFAKVFEAPTNLESVYITALILFLIIKPLGNIHDIIFLGWAATLAMAGKYILAINKKHIFNPAALAVFLTAIGIGASANWWIGSKSLLPFVAIGGFLIVRKIKRSDLIFGFFAVSLATIAAFAIFKGSSIITTLQKTIFDSPLVFFATIMLTEPLTTPPTKILQAMYGALTGFLFVPYIHIGGFYTTPEIALLIGNAVSFMISPKDKLMLTLKEKIKIAPNIYDFIFTSNQKMNFVPGQYMEWTLAHGNTDSRGSRRYMTIASSPTETDIRVGVKFAENGSSWKKSLLELGSAKHIVASQLAGEFTLPKDKNKKLVFIAGGIGVTPYRSMVKYLLDQGETRDIVILYAAKTKDDFVYKNIFSKAKALGVTTHYITSAEGHINEEMIMKLIPDFKDRTFYFSGPRSMIVSIDKNLHKMKLPKSRIITDYFPGF